MATPPLKLPALDPATLAPSRGNPDYPKQFWPAVVGGDRRRLGDALGLTNFGVNLVRMPPGLQTALRHWHTRQDEFVFVLSGEVTVISDAGPQRLTAGMAAGFPAGKPDGHHIVNLSDKEAVILEIGDRAPDDEGEFPDVDMVWRNVDGDQRYVYLHKDGTPY